MRWLLPRAYAEDPRAFRVAVTGGRFPSRYFSTEPLGYGFEIGGGIWYNPGCSTSEKMETLRRIVDRSTRWSRATSPLRCGGRWGFSGSPAGAALRAPVPNGMAKRALVAPGSPLWRLACLAKA